jgi:deoxyribodipyrimidine photo-lyase
MIEPTRIQRLNELHPRPRGRYVLYWMQQSQRVRFNHALEYAIEQANALQLPVVVCFGLMDNYPEANQRHYAFMLQGLCAVEAALKRRGIRLVVRRGAPPDVAIHVAKRAAVVVCDRGYLRHQRRWRDAVADRANCRVVQVESDVVVPIEVTSNKAEFAARTIRPKILKHRDTYLKPLRAGRPKHSSLALRVAGNIDVRHPRKVLQNLKLDRSVPISTRLIGGEDEAHRRLRAFISRHAASYDTARNEPGAVATSMMSPYLHFGQISPIEIALAVRAAKIPAGDREAYLEQLIVRRELSMNFVHYTPNYDRYDALPAWARKTLDAHAKDSRPTVYTRAHFSSAATHDRW